jgi:ABC-type transport system involved in cytochrome c biogenesis permease subunit
MSFIAGISITCFAASYLVAWLLELSRLFFRSGVRRAVMLGFAGAGVLAQTLFLGYRAAQSASLPLSSSFDWYLLAAWMLAVAYLILTYYYPRAGIGLYLWPLILGLIGAAAWLADREPIAPKPASQIWGIIHGVFLLLGTVTVMVGFMAGVMYLVQAGRLKRKQPLTGGFQLPTLEWLEQVSGRVIFSSAVMVGIGFFAGIVLNVIGGKTAVPWTDPVVWSSGLMWAWLLVAALFNAFYRPSRHGRKVAYLTVVNFIFLAIALGTLLLVNTEHGGQKPVRHKSAARLAAPHVATTHHAQPGAPARACA